MEIYLLRHGIAEEKTESGNDRERPLTAVGRKKIAALAGRLKEMEVAFDVILSSPLVRARQTAEVVARKLKHKEEIAYTGNLMPGFKPKALVKELKKNFGEGGRVLLVGHEPDLSGLASYLLTGTTALSLELKKGGICKLELQSWGTSPGATLILLLAPKALGI